MKSLRLLLVSLFLVLSFSASAANVWYCTPTTQSGLVALEQLNLNKELYHRGAKALKINMYSYCGKEKYPSEVDRCEFKNNLLIIGTNKSVLFSYKGTTVELTCSPEELAGPQGGIGGSN